MKEQSSNKRFSTEKEIEIAQYLADNPDFFDRHPSQLEALSLPNKMGNVVSLIERQVRMLRDKSTRFEKQLGDLLVVARDNESLANRLQKLAIELLFTQSADEALAATRSILIDDFTTEFVTTLLISSDPDFTEISGVNTLQKDSPKLDFFAEILKQKKPVCGKPEQDQLEVLFPGKTAQIKSVAIVPLNAGVELGILALGSSDKERFKSSQGTLFLEYLSNLVSACLTTRLKMC